MGQSEHERERSAATHEPISEGAPSAPYLTDGSPRLGTFLGSVERVDLAPMLLAYGERPRLTRLKQEKRWQWWGVIDEHMAVGSAIVRLGYISQGFFWCFDRDRQEMWCDEEVILPPFGASISSRPLDPDVATLTALDRSVWHVARPDAHHASMRGGIKGVSWDLSLEDIDGASASPITAIAPVARARLNVTVKQAGLRASGQVRVGGKFHRFGPEALGFLDYTHGLLERHTAWRWGIGAGTISGGSPFSFNVVQGFNQGLENVCWLDGEVIPLGEVRFEHDVSAPKTPWRIRGAGIDLALEVEGVRQAATDLKLVASRYVQPIGAWSGTILGERVAHAVGVAEDHQAKW